MITVQNLKEVLLKLGFAEASNGVFKKQYPHDASIVVDFNRKKIAYAPVDSTFTEGEYPTKTKPATGFVIHRETTLDFIHPENFVCLVCVHLLLEKGYEPKHMVFEPAFKVGHNNKPSYGDILVYNEQYNPLVLIENKTYGPEFSKEWNNMQKNGGQLFSYLGPLVNELGLCENLVLFAVDFDNNDIVLKNHIITLKDNDNADLGSAKKFKNAQGKYFEVWNETYAKSFETKGLFEQDVAPYSVGKLKYTIADLKSLSHSEIRPIYHEFATILRNHAITDFEHSFYILIDLFLCKITDERRNPDDLQFYYKGISRDTPKKYCARLLKLYQQGKHDLFDVDVVNKDEDDIRQIFEDTSRSLTNGLFEGIRELFEEIKFYNIKKFNFIDVENKEEFEMNFQILIKIAALIQDINLSNSETNHFFGDLFEGLLSKNVHQTEGQFFTPLPIVNFIIKSLPEFPDNQNIKVLDYACGAGHFLTEFIKCYPHSSAFGIEKSQTLSQVAKIATIINGSQDAHIVFKDSLSVFNTRETRFQGFDNESFDLIIANPPYSVKGFLNTLDENDRDQYELTKLVKEKSYGTNKTIESFFVERAKHFLRQNGLIGIVLPSSILSNEDSINVKTRELLFAHFNILSIVGLGSRTFGSTGTNTIILFAQKVKKNAEGLVEHFIKNDRFEQYTNYQAIDSYINKQGYDKEAFFAFMQTDTLEDVLENHEVFREYKMAFRSTAIKKTLQLEWFKNSSFYNKREKGNSKIDKQLLATFLESGEYKEYEEAEQRKQFISYAKAIECDKLYTFIQIENNYILLLQSPPERVNNKSNKAEIIKFLGYDWSNRKGDEGIKYITKTSFVDDEDGQSSDEKDAEIVRAINSIKYIDTPLYNPDQAWDNTKFAFALRKHIYDQCKKFSFGPNEPKDEKDQLFEGQMDELLSFASLSDLMDFTRPTFNKTIKTATVKPFITSNKYRMVRLELLMDSITGAQTKIPQEEIKEFGTYPVITQESENFISGYTNNDEPITDLPLIVFGDHSCTYKYVDFPFVRGADGTQLIKVTASVDLKYLYNFLQAIEIENQGKYERHFKYLKDTKIPVPPIEVQREISAACEQIDADFISAPSKNLEAKQHINDLFDKIKDEKVNLKQICQYSTERTSKVDAAKYITTDNMLQDCEGITAYTGTDDIPSAIVYKKGDILVSNIRPYLQKIWYADRDGACSPDVLVFRVSDARIDSKFLYYSMKRTQFFDFIMNSAGVKGLKMPRGDKDAILNYEIRIPSLKAQADIIKQIKQYEAEIRQTQELIKSSAARKKVIIEQYLND